jgi:glucokinase
MTPGTLRGINSRAVLQLLRAHSPCSCADLARYSGLSAPTVATSVALLERLKLVNRLGNGRSSGGRPPALLEFNRKYGYVAGVDVTAAKLRVRVVDLGGNTVGESESRVGENSWPAAIVEQISIMLAGLRHSLKIPAKRMLGIGVSAPGITNVNAGVVAFVPGMSAWENVPLGRMLTEKTGIETVVENDVNLAALAEHAHGIARDEKNFVFVSIDRGVGAGLFINGKLHHGPEWTAGEIGYLSFGTACTSSSPVKSSQIGALEAAIGSDGIEAQWRHLTRKPRLPAIKIFDRERAGDAAATRIVGSTAAVLAGVCTSLSLILNCSLIVLGGELGMHESLLKATASLLERNEFARPRLAVSQLGQDAALLGAVRLGLQAAESALP